MVYPFRFHLKSHSFLNYSQDCLLCLKSQNMELTAIDKILSLPELQDGAAIVNVFDRQHRILAWNEGCERLFGIKKEVAIGSILEDLLPHIKGDVKLRNLDRAFHGQKIHILNEKYNATDGYYEQKLIPVKDEAGHVYAVVNIVRNLP